VAPSVVIASRLAVRPVESARRVARAGLPLATAIALQAPRPLARVRRGA